MKNKDNKPVRPLCDPELEFSKMDEAELRNYWKICYPKGSGPLGEMRLACKLIENVAHLRGIDTSKWIE